MFTESLQLSNPELTLLVSAVVGLLVSSLLGYRIGQRRRRPVLGFVLSGLLALPGLFAIALMPHKDPEFY